MEILAVLVVSLLFVAIVGVDSASEIQVDVDRIFNETVNASKACLVDFKRLNCNPMNLDSNCSTLFECIKEDPDNEYLDRSAGWVKMVMQNMYEHLFVPVSLIGVAILAKIGNSLQKMKQGIQ